jgi:hypothetical protein
MKQACLLAACAHELCGMPMHIAELIAYTYHFSLNENICLSYKTS